MYNVEPRSDIKLFFILAILLFLISIFNAVMRKYLKVKKRKPFSCNYVNKKHKKIDYIIIISFIIILLMTISYQNRNINGVSWYLEVWFVMLMFLVTSETFRAFMEWKYAENSKAYILTISQLIFSLALLGILIISNFFNI
ncbi:DUF4181 domain-containing protein [Senegalia massiliensis]|uniref:DUF4181 domain-containing protein n=1 Tax=Senegalia massiliensis TaxID=1720316 RepID=UPI0010301A66|nr:DUF4181 domain-containing protein [Senegalia massiliensis]